jgi:hypothetical protein
MARKAGNNQFSMTIKVPQSIIEDADACVAATPDSNLSNVTRSDIIRVAIRRGLDSIIEQQRKAGHTSSKRNS